MFRAWFDRVRQCRPPDADVRRLGRTCSISGDCGTVEQGGDGTSSQLPGPVFFTSTVSSRTGRHTDADPYKQRSAQRIIRQTRQLRQGIQPW